MAEWWELLQLDPFGTLAPSGLAGMRSPLGAYGQTPAQRTDGQMVAGSQPGKIGPPTTHPLSSDALGMETLRIAGGLSPLASYEDLAKAWPKMMGARTWGELLPPAAAAGVALAGMVPVGGPSAKGGKLAMDTAARMARADAGGFFRKMPLLVGTAPEGERVAQAAIQTADGKVYTGATHGEAAEKIEAALRRQINPRTDFSPMWDGFVTSSGRYVGRHEAETMIRGTGQDAGKGADPFRARYGMTSESLRPADPVQPSEVRTGATAPGLPGIEGYWARLNLPPSAAIPHPGASATPATGTVEAWHRANKPAPLDATGLSQTDLQATIRNAWDDGYDALKVMNYTPPGEKSPGTFIVVKDLAQFRTPSAAFDPAKRTSRNLTAGLATIGVPAITWGMMLGPRAEESY